MRIVVHHSKFYDWEPVPSDVKITPEDIASGKVKPAGRAGGWLMPVTKEPVGGTHTQINLPEEQIIAKVIHEATRPGGGRHFTRCEAVAMYLSENVTHHMTHRSWITKFEIDDDGPNEVLFRKMLGEHVAVGNIAAEDLDSHVEAYLETADSDHHIEHLYKHFRIKTVSK